MMIIDRVKRYRNVYKNWELCLWNLFVIKRKAIQIILRNGEKFQVSPEKACNIPRIFTYGNDFSNVIKYIKDLPIIYKGIEIALEGNTGGNGDILDIFLAGDYKFLEVKNNIVIDIGANIGDSAIYFILNGAKKVIALEPYPFSYNFAVENIKKYSMQDKVVLLNAGYGINKNIKVDESKIVNCGTELVESESGVEIPLYSLKALIEKYGITEAILKMDCEGCEYNIISEDNDTLCKFHMIQIEYHYGYEKLEEKLKMAGFNTTHTEPKNFFNTQAANPNMLLGYIYAKR